MGQFKKMTTQVLWKMINQSGTLLMSTLPVLTLGYPQSSNHSTMRYPQKLKF